MSCLTGMGGEGGWNSGTFPHPWMPWDPIQQSPSCFTPLTSSDPHQVLEEAGPLPATPAHFSPQQRP